MQLRDSSPTHNIYFVGLQLRDSSPTHNINFVGFQIRDAIHIHDIYFVDFKFRDSFHRHYIYFVDLPFKDFIHRHNINFFGFPFRDAIHRHNSGFVRDNIHTVDTTLTLKISCWSSNILLARLLEIGINQVTRFFTTIFVEQTNCTSNHELLDINIFLKRFDFADIFEFLSPISMIPRSQAQRYPSYTRTVESSLASQTVRYHE